MPSPFDPLRKVILAINAKGNAKSLMTDIRRLVALTVRAKGRLREDLEGIADLMERHARETGSWVPPQSLAEGKGGRFDACDLRHWIALAERAGVPYVPARIVLSLGEEEMEVASGPVDIPDTLRRRLAAAAEKHLAPLEVPQGERRTPDRADVFESLHAALDDVPEGWMVRSTRCGPSTLKSLAGVGAAGPTPPEVRFGPDLEIGPGWVRNGNRRRIDASDRRIVEGAAQGPVGPTVFVARPWVSAARFHVGDDPHRHGSQFAGKGIWPAEWRCLVEPDGAGGISIAVANYYGWTGEPCPESARQAVAVRDLCRKIVDEALAQNAIPMFWDLELTREALAVKDIIAERRPPDSFACTIDFIETKDGPVMLEGGPSSLFAVLTLDHLRRCGVPEDKLPKGSVPAALGGAHPCAFAAVERPSGVAFRCMDGVLIGDPKTWIEPRDPKGAILTWEEVETLALQEELAPTSSVP